MHTRARILTRLLFVLLALALVATGCKKETPKPKAPKAEKPKEPPKPKVEVLDLDQLKGSLDNLADAANATKALEKLAAVLAGKNAQFEIPAAQKKRAEQMLFDGSFALLVQSALTKGNPKTVAAVAGLDAEKLATPSQALLAFGKKAGEPTPANKAAKLVAWLTAEPKERAAGLPSPDVTAWASFVRDDSAAGVAVRTAMLQVVDRWLDAFLKADDAHRPALSATTLGHFLCAHCDAAAQPDAAAVAKALYAPDNLGYVCQAAAAQLGDKAPYAFPAALAAACKAPDYGLSEQKQLETLTAENHVLLKGLALAIQAGRPAPAELGGLAALHQKAAKGVADKLAKAAVALHLPWLPVPPQDQEAAKAAVVPPAHLSATGPARANLPLETLVIDEAGFAAAMRPVASVRQGSIVLEDQGAGLAFPGKPLVTAEGVEASDKVRDEAAKAAGEKVADEDVITEVVAGLKAAAATVAPIATRVLAKAPQEGRNAAREEGRSTLVLAVDAEAPAWLLRRGLASAEAAGYGYQLVHKPEAGRFADDAVLPVVFRSTEALPEGFAAPTHKRPIIVSVEAKQIRVFPPDRKLKGAAPKEAAETPEIEWPEGAKLTLDKRKLFSVDFPLPAADQAIGEAVATAVRKLQRDRNAGNVLYLVASSDAKAGRMIEVADALTSAPGTPLAPQPFEPALACEGATCPQRVVVWFPDVRLPEMRKTKVAEPLGPPGFCSQANIASVIKSRQGRLRYCYESELQLNPSLSGSVVVRFTIDKDGSTKRVGTSGTIRNKKVHGCVKKTFSGMRFKKPDGGVCEVRWPLKFQ